MSTAFRILGAVLSIAAAIVLCLMAVALRGAQSDLEDARAELAAAVEVADACHAKVEGYGKALYLSIDNTRIMADALSDLLNGGVLAVDMAGMEKANTQQEIVNGLILNANDEPCAALDKSGNP